MPLKNMCRLFLHRKSFILLYSWEFHRAYFTCIYFYTIQITLGNKYYTRGSSDRRHYEKKKLRLIKVPQIHLCMLRKRVNQICNYSDLIEIVRIRLEFCSISRGKCNVYLREICFPSTLSYTFACIQFFLCCSFYFGKNNVSRQIFIDWKFFCVMQTCYRLFY